MCAVTILPERADSTSVPINSALDLALHRIEFTLLAPIAIEPVIPEPVPSLVILGLLGLDKLVAEGDIQQRMCNTLSIRYSYVFSAEPFTWQEHCYKQDHGQPSLVVRWHFNTVSESFGNYTCSISCHSQVEKLNNTVKYKDRVTPSTTVVHCFWPHESHC